MTENSTQSTRLKKLLEHLNLNQSELAAILEINPSYISQIVRGKLQISTTMIISILTHYPNLNASWLLAGIGDMFISPKNIDRMGTENQEESVNEPKAVYSDSLKQIEDALRKVLDRLETLEQDVQELKSNQTGQ